MRKLCLFIFSLSSFSISSAPTPTLSKNEQKELDLFRSNIRSDAFKYFKAFKSNKQNDTEDETAFIKGCTSALYKKHIKKDSSIKKIIKKALPSLHVTKKDPINNQETLVSKKEREKKAIDFKKKEIYKACQVTFKTQSLTQSGLNIDQASRKKHMEKKGVVGKATETLDKINPFKKKYKRPYEKPLLKNPLSHDKSTTYTLYQLRELYENALRFEKDFQNFHQNLNDLKSLQIFSGFSNYFKDLTQIQKNDDLISKLISMGKMIPQINGKLEKLLTSLGHNDPRKIIAPFLNMLPFGNVVQGAAHYGIESIKYLDKAIGYVENNRNLLDKALGIMHKGFRGKGHKLGKSTKSFTTFDQKLNFFKSLIGRYGIDLYKKDIQTNYLESIITNEKERKTVLNAAELLRKHLNSMTPAMALMMDITNALASKKKYIEQSLEITVATLSKIKDKGLKKETYQKISDFRRKLQTYMKNKPSKSDNSYSRIN